MTDLPVLAHDYSAISTLHTCARMYQHKYKQYLRPAEPEPPYLTGGQGGHAALHYLYTEAWDLEGALDALRTSWGGYETPPGHKHGYLTLGHMEAVIEEYFRDRSERPTALEQEDMRSTRLNAEEAIVFEWPHPQTGEILIVGGKPDLPTQLAAQNYMIDNKFTTSWINSHWAKRFQLGHQFRIYCAAMEVLTGERYEGAYINAIYIGEPPKRGWGSGKSVQNMLLGPFTYTEEHMIETWEWLKAGQEMEQLFDQLGFWPQNEQACDSYGGCDYLPICERTPKLRDFVIRQQYRQRPPTGKLVSGADNV